ncbi:MAG: ABC transporter substrate-binding protein [Bacillota bacterium]|jgi:branched-chain amino acid transport system substrate-binding protein
MRPKWVLQILLALLCSLTVMAGGCRRDRTIKIGTIQPISGQIAAYGSQTRDAIVMAVDEINAQGGVLGKRLKLMVEDDENNPEKTMNAFIKLTAKDRVVGIIGALTSKCSLAIAQDAQARQVVLISPASTNDTLTTAGDYIFRACYQDSFQGRVCAQFAVNTLRATRAAILFDITNDYSKGLMRNFQKKFTTLGGKVTGCESYSTGDKDFNAQLTKIKATRPEVLFLPDYYSTVALIAKQARSQGITIPLLGSDGWDEIVNNAGAEVVDCYYSNHYSPEDVDPDVQAFVRKFKTRYRLTPNALAALGYDAAHLLVEAIKKAGTVEPEPLKTALFQTNRKFVTGRIKFDATGNPVKSAVMLKIIKDSTGKLKTEYAGTVNP